MRNSSHTAAPAGDLAVVTGAAARASTRSPAVRIGLAVAITLAAFGVQWLLWDYFTPYVWLLFFPAAFFSAWVGGLAGGLVAMLTGALLVWYFFIPPVLSLGPKESSAGYSVLVYLLMGGLFVWFQNHLRRWMHRTDEALAAAETANVRLTRLYERTLELDTLKSRLFANLSHELRTPLTLILAPLERRLSSLVDAGAPLDERHETEVMLRNARLLYRHVADMLDAARLEAGAMTMSWSRLDLAALLRAMAASFEFVAEERGITLEVDAPQSMPAEADGEKLQRVVLNLLSNAFKFTPDGGRVTLRLRPEDEHAVIEVLDSGPGVPAALRQAVFERFHQGESGAGRRQGGTGLGLAIVKDFVELHGGEASLAEAPGGGAACRVRLPLAAPPGTAFGPRLTLDAVIGRQVVEELQARQPGDERGDGGDAPLVLVVEDNVDLNGFIAATLRPDYRVQSAFDGREGLEKALALQPDLILSDLMMPGMSGEDMVRELRRQAAMRDVPVVMLTARVEPELRQRLLRDGVQDYLGKPFSTEELLARVGGLVASRRRTAEQLGRSAARLRQLAEVVERIGAVRDLPSLTAIVRRAVVELTGADGASVVLRDKGECHYVDEDAIGPLWKGQRFPLEACISGWAMLHGETVVVEDIYADARIPHAAYRDTFVKSLAMVPVGRDRARAAIGCYWASRHSASKEEVELQQAVADAMAVGLANLELFAGMESARKAAEAAAAAAHESEQRFRATFEQAAVGIALLAPDGHWLQVNERLCDIVAYSRDELLGMTFQDISHPDDLEADLACVAQLLAGERDSYALEKRYRRKDAALVWVNLTVSLVRHADGSPHHFIAVVEDIQRRKEAEAALRASEANLREAQRLARIGNWEWDLRTDRHDWSEEIYRLYGRDPALPPAIFPEVQRYFTPESWAGLAGAVEAALKDGRAYECDAEVVRADGSHRWVTARGEVVRDADGVLTRLHGTVQDITERKQAAAALQALNASLEQRVEQRTAELTAANRELDSFAYAVSHDLRAPLRAMSGFSHALLEDYGEQLDGQARTFLEQIGIASRKMGELIDGLLALSRHSRGVLVRETVDVSALATDILAQLARGQPERAVRTEVEPGLMVRGSARMIEAVLQNLLGNAWKYTARTAAPAIRVGRGAVGEVHGICVADNGAGFDMAYAGQLFQPFRRLHREDEFPGIGIGLATVHRIVRRHGGEIDVQAEPDKGATFCFTLGDEGASA